MPAFGVGLSLELTGGLLLLAAFAGGAVDVLEEPVGIGSLVAGQFLWCVVLGFLLRPSSSPPISIDR